MRGTAFHWLRTAVPFANPRREECESDVAVPEGDAFLSQRRLKRALELSLDIEALLSEDSGVDARSRYRLRLARAHSLGTIDALTELVCRKEHEPVSVSRSGVFTVADTERHR